MERDTYNPGHFESFDDDTDDGEGSTDNRKTRRAHDLARLLAKHDEAKGAVVRPEKTKPKLHEMPADKPAREHPEEPTEVTARDSDEPEAAALSATDAAEAEAAEMVGEDEAPLETMSEDEKLLDMQAYVTARLEELADDQSQVDAETAAARQAATSWLGSLRDRLARIEGAQADAVIEESFDDATAELGDEDPELTGPFDAAETAGREDADNDDSVATEPPTATVGGSGAGLPPSPPTVPPAPFAGGPAGPRRHETPPPASASAGERTISQNESYYYERRAQQRGLLVGGVVGYLIGRRRGRIKTEARLTAVQKKLEQQVIAAQETIRRKEDVIQQLARQHYRRVTSVVEAPAAAATVVAASPAERVVPTVSERPSVSAERPMAAPAQPEAARPTPAAPLEKPVTANGRRSERPASAERDTKPTTVGELDRQQLLEVSGKIRFGETNLRRVFEAKLVDEAGLRRLVQEYYEGHDLRRALAREFLAKELRFERDPRLRGHVPEGTTVGGGTAISSAAVSDASSDGPLAGGTDQAAPGQATPATAAHRSRQTDASPGLVIGLVVLTVALAIYAVWLTLTR